MNQPNIGAVIGGFRLDEVAGVGGMGTVYRAYDLTLDRVVAVKVIAPHLARDAEFRERFRREGRLAAALDHPHVVPVLGAGEDRGFLYLTMRFIEGTDFARIVRESAPLAPAHAVHLLTQVAAALDAAHARGLVHRDVKPANVLVARRDGQAHCYLTDFGITKEVATPGVTQAGLVVGTVDYMAPEQALAGAFDGRADQYALACVLFQAVTGRVPYANGNQVARLTAHVRAPVPDIREVLPGLTPALADVVRRGMAKRPEERFATCREFAAAATASVAGPVPRTSTPAASPTGPSRRVLLGAGATVAVGAAGGAIYAVNRPDGGVRAAPSSSTGSTVSGPVVAEVVGPAISLPGETRHLDGDDTRLWSANGDAASISRIDVASQKVTDTVSVSGVPSWLAVGQGRIYVWSYSSAFAVHDADSGQKVGTDLLRVEEEMREFSAHDPDLWFTVPGKNAVGMVDMRSGTVRHRLIDIGGRPLGLDASEGQVHVVSENGPTLITVDAADGRVVNEVRLPSGMHSVAAVPDGDTFVAGRPGVAKVSGAAVPASDLVKANRDDMLEPVADGMWVLNLGKSTLRKVGADLSTDLGRPVDRLPSIIAAMHLIAGSLWVVPEPSGAVQVRPRTSPGATQG